MGLHIEITEGEGGVICVTTPDSSTSHDSPNKALAHVSKLLAVAPAAEPTPAAAKKGK